MMITNRIASDSKTDIRAWRALLYHHIGFLLASVVALIVSTSIYASIESKLITCEVASANHQIIEAPSVTGAWREIVQFMQNGVYVEIGDTVAQLFQADIKIRLDQLIARIEDTTMQADLDKSSLLNELYLAEIELIKAQREFSMASLEYGIPEGIVSEIRRTTASVNYELASADLQTQEFILSDLQSMYEFLIETQRKVLSLMVEGADDLRREKNKLTIRAKQSGYLIRTYDNRSARVFRVGDAPQPGTTLAMIIDKDDISLECNVSSLVYRQISQNPSWYREVLELIHPNGDRFNLDGELVGYYLTPISNREIRYFNLVLRLRNTDLLHKAMLLPGMTVGLLIEADSGTSE